MANAWPCFSTAFFHHKLAYYSTVFTRKTTYYRNIIYCIPTWVTNVIYDSLGMAYVRRLVIYVLPGNKNESILHYLWSLTVWWVLANLVYIFSNRLSKLQSKETSFLVIELNYYNKPAFFLFLALLAPCSSSSLTHCEHVPFSHLT